ncbi:SCO family protein [Kozakia baliensis]|uniref:SCO family protein n=1 Tax=Kozakia baliensis TaxID=153496 RepID=UPI0004966843|nr:SCO family protein [Kozakia baliensis]
MQRGSPWTSTRLLIVVVILAMALGWSGYRLSLRYGNSLSSQGNEVGGTYRLTALGEGTVTEGDFHGSWVLMWFFDTHCPTSLCGPVFKTMSDAKVELSHDGIRLAPLAVTLDPRHDESAQLQDYVLPLGTDVVPLTASPNMVSAVAKEFHAPIEMTKAPDGTEYHTPAPHIVIMDPRGHYAGTVDMTVSTSELVERIHQLAHHD